MEICGGGPWSPCSAPARAVTSTCRPRPQPRQAPATRPLCALIPPINYPRTRSPRRTMSPLEGCGLRWDAAGCCSVGRCGYLQGRGRGARRHVVTICSRAAPPDAPRCQQHETAPVIAAAIAVRARAPSAVAAAAGRRPPGRLPCNHPIHHRLNQDQYLPSRSEHCRRTHWRSRRRSCPATI